jgi:hypothetical protein
MTPSATGERRSGSGRALAAITTASSPRMGSSGVQVPSAITRPAPKPASSNRTVAALGPPIPADWIVSSRPSCVSPEYPQSPKP